MCLSNCLVALDGFSQLDRHLVVTLWSAPECAPTVVVVDQQFIQPATARGPFRSCKHVLFTVVDDQRAMDVFKPVSAIHVLSDHSHVLPLPECLGACFSPSIVSHLQLSGCSPHQNRSTSQRIDPRTFLDQPTIPPSSHLPCIPEFRGARTATCTVSLTPRAPRAWISPTSSVSVAGSPSMSLSVSRSGGPGVDCPPSAATSTSRPSCLRQHESIMVPTWVLPSAQAWSCAEIRAQCDTD